MVNRKSPTNMAGYNRRTFLKTAAVGVGSFALASVSTAKKSVANRANILFAFADDWGWPHAGVYGDTTVKTPVFDRIAKEGVLFTHAFVSSPSCTPCRGSLLTGQHFWRLGHGANLHSTLPAEIPVYPELLPQAGYFVGYTGKGWGPGRRDGRKQNPAGPNFKNFEQFLRQRSKGRPFCFWFGSKDPHRGYDTDLQKKMGIDPNDVQVPPFFPAVAAVQKDIADYYAEVQRFDSDVGQLIGRLEQIGELDNTIVVVSGDHGMPFPRCKTNLYDCGVRVPLAIRWPEKVKAGRRVSDLVSLTELAPTFLEIAGVAIPEQMTGRSLLSILTSDKQGLVDSRRDCVFFGRERHCPCQEKPTSGGYPMRAIRTHDYLYIRNFLPQRWPAGTPEYERAYKDKGWLGDCDNGPTKYYMWANRFDPKVKPLYELAFAKRASEELYDLKADPHQMRNVAGESAYMQARTELSKKLMDELRRTHDPRVLGQGERFDLYPYYGGIPRWPGHETMDKYRNQ